MHDGETIELCAPFGAFPGAPSHKSHLISTADNKGSGATLAAGLLDMQGEIGSTICGGVEPQPLDSNSIEFSGGDGDVADNVDGFLDEFLALVDDSSSGGAGGGSGGMDDMMDIGGNGDGNGDIAGEDLGWLEDMDLAAFLPPPAAPDALSDEDANGPPPPSSVGEIEPVPAPAAVAAAAVTATSQMEAPSPRPGGEVSNTVDTSSATAIGASPSPARPAAAAPVCAGGAGGNDDGGAAAQEGDGGGSVDSDESGGSVSRKEQLRRQKVARYLAKKKTRRWSKAAASSYQSRQRVANSRPRHKGRFLPLESDFVPIAELQRRQRALMKQMQEKAAAAKASATATAIAGTPSSGPVEGEGGASPLAIATPAAAAAAASGNVSPLSHEFCNQVAI